MPVSSDDLALIKDRGPRWEEAWRRLWEQAYLRLQEWVKPGPANEPDRCKLNRKYFAVLRTEDEADDFIAQFLQDLHRRAYEGTLLAGFDLAAGTDVCSYLIRIAPQRAATHMKKRRIRARFQSPDELNAKERSESLPMAEIANCFAEIDHPVGVAVDAVVRQAAMQMHPRLEPQVENHQTLQDDLQATVRPASHSSGLDHLKAQHLKRGTALEREIAALDERYQRAVRPGSATELGTVLDLERRRTEIEVDAIIAPLDERAVTALLEVNGVAARRQISRYRSRESLLRLFPRLRAFMEAFNDGRLNRYLGEGAEVSE